jgi:hypothetical protein
LGLVHPKRPCLGVYIAGLLPQKSDAIRPASSFVGAWYTGPSVLNGNVGDAQLDHGSRAGGLVGSQWSVYMRVMSTLERVAPPPSLVSNAAFARIICQTCRPACCSSYPVAELLWPVLRTHSSARTLSPSVIGWNQHYSVISSGSVYQSYSIGVAPATPTVQNKPRRAWLTARGHGLR